MKREDILHLAELARIELRDDEIDRFTREFGAILEYVDSIKSLTKGAVDGPRVGPVFNVFREDKDPHDGGIYSHDLLALAPLKQGRYIRVKKIIDQGS